MIDFRSDTVTKPTPAMREAMAHAHVGDDVYQDDPTVVELETLAAQLTHKEAGLFVPSGTMGNQIAILTHTQRGDEIILGAHSHIKTYEVGAAAVLSGVSYHTVKEHRGMLDLSAIEAGIRGEDIHFPKTSLICIENAHGSGVVGSLASMKAIYELAHAHDLAVHLDGARVFNAAVHLGVDVHELTQYADSVMLCLSKGLASPIGSLLVGSKTFIAKARKYRKLLGGGMRQVGVLAAPGLIALREMTKRLHRDHENAQYLAKHLARKDGFVVDEDALDINMVFVKMPVDRQHFAAFMAEHGILVGGYKGETMRLVCHNDLPREAIDTFLTLVDAYLKANPILKEK